MGLVAVADSLNRGSYPTVASREATRAVTESFRREMIAGRRTHHEFASLLMANVNGSKPIINTRDACSPAVYITLFFGSLCASSLHVSWRTG